MSSVPLAAALAGLLAVGIATPASGTSEVVGEPAADRVTDPRHLVNDPRSDDTLENQAQNTPSLAANGSTLIASYNDGIPGAPDFSPRVGYSVSTDSGATWQDRGLVTSDQWEVKGPASVAGDPSRGVSYLAARAASSADPENQQIVVFPVDASGRLGSPVAASDSDVAPVDPWLAVDDFPGARRGTLYLGYTTGSDDMWLTRSTDGGATWSDATEIQASALFPEYQARVVVSPDHCVHIAYFESRSGPDSINMQTSCDGGVTFGPEVVVTTMLAKNFGSPDGDLFIEGSFSTTSVPGIAVNPVTGALYLAYNDLTTPSAADADVFLTSSTDGGSTWSTPTRVNTDTGDNDQFSPVVAVTEDGERLFVSYYDRRSDPIDLDTQRWGRTAAIDVGNDSVRWANEFRLGPSFPPVKDTSVDPMNTFSDHEAVTTIGNSFVTAWTDNRDGGQVSAFQSDIRSATVATGEPTDLSIVVAAPGDVVALGATYSYTATVHNGSDQPAGNVAVRTLLPLHSKYLSATVGGVGRCNRLGRDVTCTVDTLDPGASIDVTVTAQALRPGPLQRTVTATTSTLERRVGNNSAAADAQVSAAVTMTERFTTGDIAVRISSGEQTVVPLDIDSSAGAALDLDVGVRLDHGNVERLSLELVSPTGVRIPLSLRNGLTTDSHYGTGANSCSGTPAVFDDAAKTSVFDADAPFVAQRAYNPEGTLSDAVGGPYDGTWRLVATSTRDGRGVIGCFGLRVEHLT